MGIWGERGRISMDPGPIRVTSLPDLDLEANLRQAVLSHDIYVIIFTRTASFFTSTRLVHRLVAYQPSNNKLFTCTVFLYNTHICTP